jgi:hypothetical protein
MASWRWHLGAMKTLLLLLAVVSASAGTITNPPTIKGGKSGEKTKDYRLQPGLTASPLNVKVEGDLQVTGAKTEVISRSPRGKRRSTTPTVKR